MEKKYELLNKDKIVKSDPQAADSSLTFELLPFETKIDIFDFLNRTDLKRARCVSGFWKHYADTTMIGMKEHATRMLYQAVKEGNIEKVRECLKRKADVNVKLRLNTSYIYYNNANLLHAIILKLRGVRNFFNIGTENYVEIFKLLLEQNIDINHSTTYGFHDSYGKAGDVAPIETLAGELTNNQLVALLHLREAEITLEKDKNIDSFFQKTIKIGKISRVIVYEYLSGIKTKQRGLCYSFANSSEDVKKILKNPKIELLMLTPSTICNVM